MPNRSHIAVMIVLTATVLSGAATATEFRVRRCGWFSNPTPGNWLLADRDGDWLIGMQGIHQATGLDNIPDLRKREWINSSNGYGYGCACMTIEARAQGATASTVKGNRVVMRFRDFEPQPLASCRRDKRLQRKK